MKKGFTLIELLAVIIIIGVIMAISIPSVIKVIDNRKKDSLLVAAKTIARNVEYDEENDVNFTHASLSELNVKGVSSDNYDLDNSYVYVENDIFKINLVGKGDFAGLYACGVSKNSLVKDVISKTACASIYTDYITSEGVNKPKLATGMTPIKWNGTTWIDTTEDDSDWYSYTTADKKWANAKTADGSFWVWIPRYIYNISSGWHSRNTGIIEVQFSRDTDDNWNNSNIGNINTGTGANASNNTWTNHPAFTFGTTQLTGIWVAKFEPTAVEGVANGFTPDFSCPISGDDVTVKTVKILPNVSSWRCITVGNAFTVSRNMETNSTYGWGTSGSGIDTHLMKNVEWGAALYLSKSIYGQNENEIWINPADDYTTGCAGDSNSSAQTTGCLRTYETTNGQKASTTGNVYGIYDMSGGAWERVAAYVDNGHTSLAANGSSIISADEKYKDIYSVGSPDNDQNDYALTINKKGEGVYETSQLEISMSTWFGDFVYMPNSSLPWFGRNSYFSATSTSGPFYIGRTDGVAESYRGFRPILLVNQEL